MKLSDIAEEILETLWISQEEKGSTDTSLKRITCENRDLALAEFIKIGCISVKNEKIRLLDKGKEYAQGTVRRHI